MERVFGNTPIYWINLDRSLDRKNNMEKQLKNLNHTRIIAIDGINEDYFLRNNNVKNLDANYSTGLTAVICSHIKAIRTAYNNNLPYVIILEDKCHFDYIEYFDSSIETIIKLLDNKDPSWELLQLSSIPLYDDLNDYIQNGLCVHKYSTKYFGLNYLINKSGIRNILNNIITNGINYFDFNKIIDKTNPEFIIYKNLNSYILNFPILYAYAEISTFPYYYNVCDNNLKNQCINAQIYTKAQIINFYEKKLIANSDIN